MSATTPLPPTPSSPGVGVRRKGPKHLPTLPLSVFAAPATGSGESFPLPPPPSVIHPSKIVDANVVVDGVNAANAREWKEQIEKAVAQAAQVPVVKDKIAGVVVSLQGAKDQSVVEEVLKSLTTSQTHILGVLIPFVLEDGVPANPPPYLTSSNQAQSQQPKIALSATFTGSTSPAATEALRWALDQGFSIDLDVEVDMRNGESGWEALEELFGKAMPREAGGPAPKGKVILSNVLPPPDDLLLPIVKLLTHPTYQAYQSHIAAISLYSNVFIKFTAPHWGSPTPATPAPVRDSTNAAEEADEEGEGAIRDTAEKKEWKRRIKMYIGPSLEAFGFARLVYGSSPSPLSRTKSDAGDWYDLAREAFAELNVEQESVDAVFYGNALRVYGGKDVSAGGEAS